MTLYNFTLLITPPAVDEETAADRLYGSGCDDALFSISGGSYEVEFDREAKTLKRAVLSAIQDIRKAKIGSQVFRVIPDDLASANVIAERSGRTRQAVGLWVRGDRGHDFPRPMTKVGASLLWSWLSVAQWLHARNELDASVVSDAATLVELNQSLELDPK